MRTEVIEIYSFDELSEEAKKKAIEQVRESYYVNNDFAEWAIDQCYLFMPEDEARKGTDIFIKNTRENIYFDTGRNRHIKCDEAMNVTDEKAFLNWLGLAEDKHNLIQWNIYTPSGRNSDTTIEILPEDENLDISEFENEHGINIKDLEDKFSNHCIDVLRSIENNIESRYEDESIIEDIQANEYEFHKDGTRY